MKEQAKDLVAFSETMSPNEQVEINLRGEVIKTSLTNLTKIKGSRLEQIFSGKVNHGRDSDGRIFLDTDA